MQIRNIYKAAIFTGSAKIQPGQVAECDKAIAQSLIAAGMAEAIAPETSDRPKKAAKKKADAAAT